MFEIVTILGGANLGLQIIASLLERGFPNSIALVVIHLAKPAQKCTKVHTFSPADRGVCSCVHISRGKSWTFLLKCC